MVVVVLPTNLLERTGQQKENICMGKCFEESRRWWRIKKEGVVFGFRERKRR